jgi:hypothetical protein
LHEVFKEVLDWTGKIPLKNKIINDMKKNIWLFLILKKNYLIKQLFFILQTYSCWHSNIYKPSRIP